MQPASEVKANRGIPLYNASVNGFGFEGSVSFDERCCISNRSVADLADDFGQREYPFALYIIKGNGKIHVMGAHAYEENPQRRPNGPGMLLLLVGQANDIALVPLVKKNHTANPERTYIKACALNITPDNRNQVAEAQYLTALRFATGTDFEKNELFAAMFAYYSAMNGHRLAGQLSGKISPAAKLATDLIPSVPATTKYPEGQKVRNVLLAFRELLADMQQVRVSDVKIFAAKESQTEKEDDLWVVRRTFKISVIGTAANGSFTITREHDAVLRPYCFATTVTSDAQKRATRIGAFLSKIWGYEIQGALNPNHPQHRVFSQHIDHLTVNPETFERSYNYRGNVAQEGFISQFNSLNTSWWSAMGITKDEFYYKDLIGSSSTKVRYSRSNTEFEVTVPKDVATY